MSIKHCFAYRCISTSKLTSLPIHSPFNHAPVLVQMARGAYQLREAVRSGHVQGSEGSDSGLEFEHMDQCHKFLDRFYMSRIGIRVLVGQYLALRTEPQPNYIGMICSQTSPSAAVQEAANDARRMCIRQYGRAPDVEIIGCLDLTFPYIPSYLRYVVLELLKNALRATAETHADAKVLPNVTVVIADGTDNEDVVIKISDQGGGIARSQVDKIWSYLFTTADPKIQEAFIGEKDHSSNSPIAGFGYGLPISRSYCRYFGGDLDVISMEGFGTDAFLHLKRLGDSKEPVPA
jgi:pyruvate dehydrogenase kinase 2/3/4